MSLELWEGLREVFLHRFRCGRARRLARDHKKSRLPPVQNNRRSSRPGEDIRRTPDRPTTQPTTLSCSYSVPSSSPWSVVRSAWFLLQTTDDYGLTLFPLGT